MATKRLTVYLPQDVVDALGSSDSVSGRITRVIDRFAFLVDKRQAAIREDFSITGEWQAIVAAYPQANVDNNDPGTAVRLIRKAIWESGRSQLAHRLDALRGGSQGQLDCVALLEAIERDRAAAANTRTADS